MRNLLELQVFLNCIMLHNVVVVLDQSVSVFMELALLYLFNFDLNRSTQFTSVNWSKLTNAKEVFQAEAKFSNLLLHFKVLRCTEFT